MSASLWSIWNAAAKLGIARPTAAEFALLILLGASLLVALTLRESYLKIWIVGWTALVASRLAEHSLAAKIPAPFGSVAVQATFVLAVGLLAGAVFLYARSRDLILPLAVITPVLVGFAGARLLLWPDSLPLRFALEVSYRIILLTASDCFAPRASRTVAAIGLVAGVVLALSVPGLVAIHRSNSSRRIPGR